MDIVTFVDSEKIISYLKRNNIISDVILRNREFVYDYAIKFSKDYPEKFIPGGVSIQEDRAKRKAFGEAMEIYSSTLFKQMSSIKSSIKKIKDIYKFLQFKEESYKDGFYSKFDNSNEIIWVRGEDIINKKDVLIPGFCVLLNYNKYHKRYYPNFSQGLGNARNLKDSIVHGVLENIEADASMVFWRNKLDLPLIKSSALKDNKLNLLIRALKNKEIKIKLIYATLDIPINMVISCLYYPNYPHMSFGFGSGKRIEDASLKAIEEALLVRNTLLLLKKYDYSKNIKEHEIKSFLDHVVYASYNPSIVKWIMELKEESIKPINHNITLQYLKKELSRRNLNCYLVNITKKVFQKIGYYQSKTILPALCQRDMNNNYKFLKNERFIKVPKELGYRTRMNLNPHPFG